LATERVAEYPYVEGGLPHVHLVGVEVRTCRACVSKALVLPNIAGLHATIAKKLLAPKLGRLAPAEIRFMRKYLGWSSATFASTIGVEDDDVVAWENDEHPVRMPFRYEVILRMLVKLQKPVESYPEDSTPTKKPSHARVASAQLHLRKSGSWACEAHG
jgi:DNA-binding XRE family transcriptional regulator